MRDNGEGELVPDPLFSVLHIGTVADRNDPEGLGRVRLLIPGIFQVPSPWALPLGTSGGGSAQRGFFSVPEVGADVGVLFAMGDYERPYYLGANWSKSELPTPLSGLSTADVPNVRVIESKHHLVWLDDRSGSEKIVIRSKSSGKEIMLGDDAATEPFVLGNALNDRIDALFDLLIAHVHPTAVGPSGPPSTAANFTTEKGLFPQVLSETIFGK